jgi:parallel beta-helix repeat protein
MNRTYAILVGMVAIAIGLARADCAAAQLPAARDVIDAGRYASLQEAINAVGEQGGILRIPPGTFEIAEPLVISASDVMLQGAGTATHIKNTNTEGKSALILRQRDEKSKEQLWRISLSDLRITGNEKSGHGIEARQINEIFIHGVTVSYHGGDGIRLDHCYEDPRVCNCLVTYNKGTGINLLGCHDSVVSANQLEENQDAARCTDGFNLCMTGNCLDDHLGDGIVIENTYGSVVSGNMIEECRGWAIVLDRDCYGDTVSANVIAHESTGGIDLRDAHGCAVSANTFTIMGGDALHIGPNSGRITVTGNNFSDSYIGGGATKRSEKDQKAGGIVLEATSDVTIVGNVFSGLKPKALTLRGKPSRRVVFASNVLTNVESDHGKLEDSVVKDNVEGSG